MSAWRLRRSTIAMVSASLALALGPGRVMARAQPQGVTSSASSKAAGAQESDPSSAGGQPGDSAGGDANASNSPLTPKPTLFIQNYYVPTTFGPSDRSADQFFIRGVLPTKLLGVQELTRLTVPIANVPTTPSGSDTGLGDLQLLTVFEKTFKGFGNVGLGPILVLPTATSRSLGQGKWQAGLAGIVISPQKWGLAGGLVTFTQSFAAEEAGRRTVSLLAVQPLLTRNLPNGFYLRSTGVATYDFATHTAVVPIGFGVGKVWKVPTGTINGYFEPQYSVAHEGPGQAKWQLLAGVTFQFK